MKPITIPGHPVAVRESPNQRARPKAHPAPSLIVLHSTGDVPNKDSAGGSISWLCNPKSKVSAHFVVSRLGEITQLVALEREAYHAGASAWLGKAYRNSVNAFSVGIEMEHVDGVEDWPEVQLRAVVALCRALQALYAIPPVQITGHDTVCLPRGRKVDPQGFPWDRLRFLLKSPDPASAPHLKIAGGSVLDGRIVQGRLLVPARLACTALGIEPGEYLPEVLGMRWPDGKTLAGGLNVAGVLYLPARDLCRIAGYDARWDGNTYELLAVK